MHRIIGVIFAALLMAACGETTTDRALSGAGIGAAAGAGAGALTGGGIGRGAIIGGVLGGGAGALSDEDDINLGRPAWD